MRKTIAILLSLAGAAGAQESPATPVLSLQPFRGFFEEAFALDGAGGRLALVRANAAGAEELELHDLDQHGALLTHFPVGPRLPTRVALAAGGTYVFTRGDDGRAEVVLHDAAGRVLRRFGPAKDLALSEHAGRATLAAFEERGATWEVTLWAPPAARPRARRTLPRDEHGLIRSLQLTPLYWTAGYTRLVGRRPGRYDRARDLRLNDTEAVYDVARGAVVRDTAPADRVAWARLIAERARHPNAGAFVYVSEDRKGLFAVSADDQVTELALPLPLERYEAASLQQQEGSDGRVTFSLTTDPLNPDAVARGKRDVELIDVYRIDPAAPGPPRPALLLRIPRDGRDFLWRAGATRIAVLRKHRAFGRGGTQIDVYELPAAKARPE